MGPVQEKIKELAQKEIDEENFRREVEEYKHILRTRKSFWDRVFPFKIIIVRKEKKDD